MSANDRQEGGSHYRSVYQHWDFVLDANLGYLEGNATKYVSRHWKKGGLADIQKAIHYVDKLIEVHGLNERDTGRARYAGQYVNKFCDENKIPMLERTIIYAVACWRTPGDLQNARLGLLALQEQVKKAHEFAKSLPQAGEDNRTGSHHPV